MGTRVGSAASGLAPRRAEGRLGRRLWNQRVLFLFALPGFVSYLLFAYLPMYGVIIAFQDYNIFRGITGSRFVGFENFRVLFGMPGFEAAFRNTVIISVLKLAIGFPATIAFALALAELGHERFKRVVQTITYLPYFISWVIAAGLWYRLLAIDPAVVNELLIKAGIVDEPIYFLGEKFWFYVVLIVTELWKNLGFGAIIYLAAIAGVDPNLYEAAKVDGAGRLRRIWHITLPSIRPTIVLLFIFAVAGLLNAGFDQIQTMMNLAVRPYADILDTFILRILTSGGLHMLSVGAAAGLFKSVVGLALFLLANFVARKLEQESVL